MFDRIRSDPPFGKGAAFDIKVGDEVSWETSSPNTRFVVNSIRYNRMKHVADYARVALSMFGRVFLIGESKREGILNKEKGEIVVAVTDGFLVLKIKGVSKNV